MEPDPIRESAVGLLLGQRLNSLFVNVPSLRFPWPVQFLAMQDYCSSRRITLDDFYALGIRDGCTFLPEEGKGPILVLYNREMRSSRRRAFTLAHEVGHISLGHREDGDPQEREANRFAAELLAPRILVRQLSLRSPALSEAELCRVFNLSREAASYRLEELRRGHTPYSPGERELLRRFGRLLPAPDRDGEPLVDF